jgi:hypothetical protein
MESKKTIQVRILDTKHKIALSAVTGIINLCYIVIYFYLNLNIPINAIKTVIEGTICLLAVVNIVISIWRGIYLIKSVNVPILRFWFIYIITSVSQTICFLFLCVITTGGDLVNVGVSYSCIVVSIAICIFNILMFNSVTDKKFDDIYEDVQMPV